MGFIEEDIIKFNKGIPGFEDLKKYIIMDIEENIDFKVLQSVEDKDIGFVVTVPFSFYEDYEVTINDDIIKRLEIENEEDVLILSIVTINEDVKKSTMNLQAPLIINMKTKLGEQYIDQREIHKIKSPLIKE